MEEGAKGGKRRARIADEPRPELPIPGACEAAPAHLRFILVATSSCLVSAIRAAAARENATMPTSSTGPHRPPRPITTYDEALRQALRIAKARESRKWSRQLRRSHASVREWIRVTTSDRPIFVPAKMGGHLWDTLEDYFRWKDTALHGSDGVRAFQALGARLARSDEASLADVEDQIGQRPRADAKVLVLPEKPVRAALGRYSPRARRASEAGKVRQTAKLIRSGRSQFVQLPEAVRFEGDEVSIYCDGSAVIIEPIAASWDWLDAIAGELDRDFLDAAEEAPLDPPERPEVERFFR